MRVSRVLIFSKGRVKGRGINEKDNEYKPLPLFCG
jgi:hypothetical protein